MSWTDERVELLKKLWMDGLSASQIAAELGNGVTRNAVIGKVHRLKLTGRAKPATSTARPRSASRPARRSSGVSSGGVRRRPGITTNVIGATALKADPSADALVEQEVYNEQELFIPVEERLTLLQLTEKTCKWPIGDPLTEEFYFCGRDSKEDAPYCEFHARKAYHQLDKRRR
ncbi:MAG: GcrA cell cycle regulator [Hyphomicrobiaceae bacterium]|nr:GcrA cell cycle regulator [Hyphomicrobiaceae bacterium]